MILYIAIYKRLSGRDPGDFHRYQLRTRHSLHQKAGISLFLPRITGIPDLFSSRLFSFSVARSPFHDLYAHVLALRVILAFKLRVLHPVLSLSLSLSNVRYASFISHEKTESAGVPSNFYDYEYVYRGKVTLCRAASFSRLLSRSLFHPSRCVFLSCSFSRSFARSHILIGFHLRF